VYSIVPWHPFQSFWGLLFHRQTTKTWINIKPRYPQHFHPTIQNIVLEFGDSVNLYWNITLKLQVKQNKNKTKSVIKNIRQPFLNYHDKQKNHTVNYNHNSSRVFLSKAQNPTGLLLTRRSRTANAENVDTQLPIW
jgi:hypothetical protein